MLVIGVCDGDTAVRVMLSDFVERYRQDTGIDVRIMAYDSSEKLLTHYPFEMDLIFLEIPFSRVSGIETARRIRVADAHVGIVFLTSVLSHVLEAYEVRANNYFIKPLRYERFLKEMEFARARRGERRFFIERNADGVYKVYSKSIRFIETRGRNTLIHCENGDIASYKTMKEHERALFEPFFARCHAGYIVNLLFLERLESRDIRLSTGERVPVSRQRRARVISKIDALYSEGEVP